MDSYILHTITTVRYGGIAFLMMIFPAETVMIVTGYVAASGKISLWLAIAAGAAGSTLGSVIIYALARSIDKKQLYQGIDRHGRLIGLRRENIQKVGSWFTMHARLTVFAARFVPALRTAVSLPAGFERMKAVPFVTYTLIGTIIDTVLLAGAGYLAKQHINQLLNIVSNAANYITYALIAALIIVLYWRGRRKHTAR